MNGTGLPVPRASRPFLRIGSRSVARCLTKPRQSDWGLMGYVFTLMVSS
jgi:hypothetical protein